MTQTNLSCTFRINDEVSTVLLGVLPHHMAALVDEFSEYVPGYKHMPLFKMGAWDGKTKFLTKTGKTYQAFIPDVIEALDRYGYRFKMQDNRPPIKIDVSPIDAHQFAHRDWIHRPHQVDAINAVINNNHRGIIIASTGAGKAQPLDAKIMTPRGWVKMGDIAVGDQISSPSGGVTQVLGVFPQGVKQIFEITFHDGSKTRACGEHLWLANVPDRPSTAKTSRKIITSLDMIDFLNKKQQNSRIIGNISIPTTAPVEYPSRNLPIDPYLIGAILGDGGLTGGSLTFSNKDLDVLEKVRSKCKELDVEFIFDNTSNCDYRARVDRFSNGPFSNLPGRKNELVERLRNLGVWGITSQVKSIPPEYMLSSVDQRLELIRGLMDTDGTVDKRGNVSFTSISRTLATQLQELVWSVGGTCTITTRTPSYTYKGQKLTGAIAYTCFIHISSNMCLFSCGWKAARQLHKSRTPITRRVIDVKSIGDAEAQCIMVSSDDHVYITDDYIVTHNTAMVAGLSQVYETVGFRSMVIVPNRDLIKQTFDQYEAFGLDVGQYSGKVKDLEHKHVISTWQALQNHPEILLTFQVVIVDEVQGAKGPTITELLIKYGNHIPVRIGCTGTLPKDPADFKTIYAGIGEKVIYTITAKELQTQGLLATLDITQLQTQDVDNPNDPANQFPEYAMEKKAVALLDHRNRWIAEFIEAIASSQGNTLILVSSIAQGKKLQKLIGGNSIFLYGKDDDATRQEVYQSFGNNDNLIVIANVQIAAVGLSINRIFNLILVDLSKAFTRVIQSIGRGLRMSHDKTHVHVYDVYSNYSFSLGHSKKRQQYYKDAFYPYVVKKINYS